MLTQTLRVNYCSRFRFEVMSRKLENFYDDGSRKKRGKDLKKNLDTFVLHIPR